MVLPLKAVSLSVYSWEPYGWGYGEVGTGDTYEP